MAQLVYSLCDSTNILQSSNAGEMDLSKILRKLWHVKCIVKDKISELDNKRCIYVNK